MNDQKGKLFRKGIHYKVSIQNPFFQFIQDLKKDGSIPTPSTKHGTWADLDEKLGQIKWDWLGWLPKGFLTIVAGESGGGKSNLILRISACYSQGWDWPDGSKYTDELGAVLWCETEEGQQMNRDRARDMGLPLDQFYSPHPDALDDINLENLKDKEAIREIASEPEVRLVIVDSLRGAHQSDEDSSKMIKIGKWLAELARDLKIPVMVSHHYRKKSINDSDEITLDRLRGSTAIVQVARMVWAIDRPDPLSEENFRLNVIKSNLGKRPEPIGFRITDTGVNFIEAPQPTHKEKTQTKKAENLLSELLKNGPVPYEKVKKVLSANGINRYTGNIAKKKLGIKSIKAEGKNGKWMWSLPAMDADVKAI